jgi:hypothetical protein
MPAPDLRDTALESILLGARSAGEGPRCVVVQATRLLSFKFDRLAQAAAGLDGGDVAVYAIALEGSIVVRLLMLVTLSVRIACARRVLHKAGAVRVRRYAVAPTLDRPTIAYELGTPAARYADRHLRPRGGSERLRGIIARVAGVDPSIGGVVVAGLKP